MVNTCFKQKSSLVKFLIFLLIALIIVLVALFVNLLIRKDDHVCDSEHCIKASAEIIRYVDQSANPCDDFHAFSCGNFIRNVKELPPADPSEELDSLITDVVRMDDVKPFSTQKLFYQACVNLGAIDMDQDESLLELFFGLGDWPVLRGSNWNGTFFDWTDMVKKSRRDGMKFDWFLDFSIFEDVNNTKTNILKIDVPSSLRRIGSKEKQLRKDLLTDIAELMGAPKYLAHYETAKTIDFEDDIGAVAEKHRRREKEMDVLSLPKLTIDEVQTLCPNIQWLRLINDVTGNMMVGSDYIVFNILDYIKDLNHLILRTPKRIVADYLMWKIIEESWQFLSQPIREKFEKYNEEVFNQLPQLDRQKFCLDESKKQFPLVAESVYIRRHVTRQKRQLVRDMLYLIRRRYVKLLENASWMSRESRRRSLTKAQDMRFVIGGPEEIFDEFRFAENLGFYGFAFKSSNIIDMLNERRTRFYDNYFSAINRMITNSTAGFYEKVINITAFSVINHNTMVIPAALLRDAFYNPNLPNYLNYGTLGRVLAHEIFDHIFNSTALVDDDNSNYNSWRVSDIFDGAVKCLIKESSYFHNSELKRPSKVRENLADFIAPDVAYDSYKAWLQFLPSETTLPALNFTQKQLFWIQTKIKVCPELESVKIPCMDPQCIKSSAEIHEFVDDQIDPCEDLHGFVCDKFMKTAYEKQVSSPLKAGTNRLENEINKFIVEPESKDDPQAVKMQKKYFQACLNEDEMDKTNTSFFSLLDVIGGWPILKRHKWRRRDFDWMKAMIAARQRGLPFGWFLNIDVYDDDNYYLRISKPKNCDSFDVSLSQEYTDMIADIVESVGGYNVNIEINDIFKFEKALAEICARVENEPVTKRPIIDLEKIWPSNMEIKKSLNNITGHVKNWELNSVVAYDRDYIIRLDHLLKNTSKEVQANYIGWKITEYFAPYLSKPIRYSYNNYIELQSEENLDRFQFCLMDTKLKFNLVSETMYIRKYANPEIKEAGKILVDSIKDELSDEIRNNEWMKNETKETYLDLLNKTETIIGGPDLMFDDEIFQKYLYVGELSFSDSNIILMLREWSTHTFFAKMSIIGEPSMTRLLIPGYMANNANDIYLTLDEDAKILLPATLFHDTTYDIGRPQYLNYASLGTLLAFKLVDEIAFSSKQGNNSYYHHFEKNQRCWIKSLIMTSNQDVLNGSLVVRANFADLMGRHLAYRAYQKYVEENEEELELAGLPYSPNQLFWIKSSMNWCYQDLPNEDPHPRVQEMLKYRVTETAKNSPFFGQDFSCEKDSLMNPSRKCSIF
ncbi:Peptidase M13 N domain containing protein [Asbolus verrucosus]|uniref:Peptidase M13 N domain containing protein n=1 Tax=Asbolus verrucosus TaxID=1661398 RepID=A0A482V0Z5_ASBVE|nr:Peptidase M13 N domain containing protein [Asbolus verrucosus]